MEACPICLSSMWSTSDNSDGSTSNICIVCSFVLVIEPRPEGER